MHYFCSTIIEQSVKKANIIEVSAESRVCVGAVDELLGRLLPERRTIVIADANIDRLHHSLLAPYEHILIGTGESVKTLHTVQQLYRRFIETEVDRSCFVLGIGGGIVTDIAGFAASTYMRGLEFGFVSTTLLGQVDASVGGKNGVNVDGFKNMAGTFTQPKFVICDTELLRTLPDREFRAGLAEIIKAAIIADAGLFGLLERSSFGELRRDGGLLGDIVTTAVGIKADIVRRDEREKGERRKLNLGHTLAHAIEKCSREMNHGEAVAAGIAMISGVAERIGLLSASDRGRIVALLGRYGFSLTPPVSLRRMMNAVFKDKKMSGEYLNLVLPTAIGRCEVRPIPRSEISGFLSNN